MRRTKIVCTLGPASSDLRIIRRMVRAGMDAARLNFSHGTHADHAQLLRKVRLAAEQQGKPVAVIQDLSGPKLRIGTLATGTVELEPGRMFVLTTRDTPGDSQCVSVNYPDLPRQLRPGDTILLADGMIELRVKSTTQHEVRCRVVIGGRLSSRKGISVPSRSLGIEPFTAKDRDDLLWGIRKAVDYVAVSYVRTADDIVRVRSFLDRNQAAISIIAKIEKHEAIDHLDDIISSADAVMVARGDLGVEVPIEAVPVIQKKIIRRAAVLGRPVITATQMLRSMAANPRPTRAEVTDVANAMLDGADATMLSEESAVGRFPVLAVEMMSRIISHAETIFPHDRWMESLQKLSEPVSGAIAGAACRLAERIGATTIVACTCSGRTALNVARLRPRARIFAPTPHPHVYRRLALAWGITPLIVRRADSDDELMRAAHDALLAQRLIHPGERIVFTAGVPVKIPGNTNFVRVITAGTI
ncbi:MAG TPA: pyruvate kinase [Kiritimatiellae bacterium]|nr:pyruvate kinase [Kiritimatiellia bacterium]